MKKAFKIFLIIGLVLLSIITWYISYKHNLVTIYNDSMGHLDVARAVVDGKQPGLAQLGSVWLPLNHILDLTLIWNDWAWHSGFAGSFFSMLAYIFGAIGIYKIIKELTGSFRASVVGALVFALNPNLLYLQTTPLTEPLYLVSFIFSVLFFVRFVKTENLKYLLLMGLFGMLQVLTRYDGWFVVFVEGLALLYQQIYVRKIGIQETIGKFFIFAMPIFFGIGAWVIWNALIFGNPLYFVFGPNSAHSQQVVIQANQGLITKKNLPISLLDYWYAVSGNVGTYLVLLGSLGAVLFIISKRTAREVSDRLLLFSILLSPVVFNVIALYLGFSALNIPQLHWVTSAGVAEYFNVRYGIMALPLVAVFVGWLASISRNKIILVLVFCAVLAQSFLIYHQGIITVAEGTTGSNTVDYGNVGTLLSQDVQPGQNVLLSTSLYSAVIFRSGFPMKDFITEGDSADWKNALQNPQNYVDWVVMGNQDLNDPIYVATLKDNPTQFQKYYRNVFCNPEICVYEKKTPAEMFVYVDGTNLQVNDTNYTIKGVNDYDLAYKSKPQIDAILKNLNEIGVNTVRFWLFGDGNTDGFQTKSGVMNESRLQVADYVIADAAKYNIRLIPVLVNNWTDYGGEQQYLKWTGQDVNNQDLFYTNPETISLFENYINHVIPRKNTITGISYNNDPTILAWEVVNEPRFSDSSAFIHWFSTITNYIKNEDTNHLVTVETDTTSFGKNNTFSIQDYCGQLSADFCTAHLYLYDSNNNPFYGNLNEVEANLKQYIDIANSDNKPFVLGEVGVPKESSPFGMKPLTVLKSMLDANNSAGELVWNWSDVADTSYGFSPFGEKGVYTLSDLSTVLGGPKPSTTYVAGADNNEGGYDISIPQPFTPEATTTTSIAPVLESASSSVTIILATTTVPVLTPPAAPISLSTSGSNQGTTISEAPLPTQTFVVAKALPYNTNVFVSNDWIDGWGSISTANGVLSVGSNASGTSAATFLSGSNAWTNYTVTAHLAWLKGSLFTLVARRTDDSNLINCVFSGIDSNQEYISINRVFNNQSQLMGSGEVILNTQPHIAEDDITVSMKVQGSSVECSIDGATVPSNLNIGLFPILLHGGIGFTTWDPNENNSEIIVKSLSVVPL
jgi:hypothetical protein